MAKPLLGEYEGLELSDDKSLQPLDVVRSGNQIRVILHSTGEIVGAIDATKLKHLFNGNDLNCDIPSTSDNLYRSLEEEHESFGNSKFSMSRYMSFAAPPSLSVDTTEYFDKSILGCFSERAPWILALLFANFFSQYVQQQLTYSMERNTKVATFMTLIIGAAGNIAAQTSTVFIRLLSRTSPNDRLKKYVLHELLVGSLLVALIVVCCGTYALFTNLGCAYIPVTVSLSLGITCSLAVLIATFLPITVKRYSSLDPALLSAPLTQTVLDIGGGAIFLYSAQYIMINWMPCGDLGHVC
jgi:cation transporter-like permease